MRSTVAEMAKVGALNGFGTEKLKIAFADRGFADDPVIHRIAQPRGTDCPRQCLSLSQISHSSRAEKGLQHTEQPEPGVDCRRSGKPLVVQIFLRIDQAVVSCDPASVTSPCANSTA